MISESQQEHAALHALGLLDADEATAFERELAADPALRAAVRELRETAAALALARAEPGVAPSPSLRDRILNHVTDGHRGASESGAHVPPLVAAKDAMIRPRFGWIPWTIAAVLLGCTVLLAIERAALTRQIAKAQRKSAVAETAPPDALSRVAFCELEPTPDAPVRPRVAVLWDAAQHKGALRINQLATPASGKDYQLWAVETARKEPVNAGVVHLDADGHADVTFQPDAIPGDNKVVALALSLERAGGSPTNQGPILFLGKL